MPDQNQSDPNNPQPTGGSLTPVITPDPITPPIVDPLASTAPISPATNTPSAFFPQEDTPPVPAFQAVTTEVPSQPIPESSPAPTEAPADTGSAAPIDAFAPTISSPKKKFGGGKVIATILGLFVLIGGVGAGIFLTQQQQLFNQKAADAGTCNCVNDNGVNLGPGTCRADDTCDCGSNKVKNNSCAGPTTGSQDNTGNLPETDIVGGDQNASSCAMGGNLWCVGCNGFCLSKSAGKTCDQAQLAKCNMQPIRGAKIVDCGSTEKRQQCYCQSDGSGSDTPTGNFNVNPTCFDATGSCTASDGLCMVEKNFLDDGSSGLACGTVVTYYCPASVNLSGGKSCDTSTGGTTTRPANFCGTIQTDTACQGFKTTIVPCGTNPPTTTGPTAQCQNVKAYSSTWAPLTTAQMSALTSGTSINFCVTGVATAGNFDKAKFTINGVAQAETTTKRPGSEDFCQSYTIPAGVSAFTVSAQIHHVTLGYK